MVKFSAIRLWTFRFLYLEPCLKILPIELIELERDEDISLHHTRSGYHIQD